jgi:tetratricopeptide (TPR) repeat protein
MGGIGDSDGRGGSGQGPRGGARLEAEGEASLARLLLDGGDGDLKHAADHVSGAVGSEPGLPEAYEALARVVARAGGPRAALELFPAERRYAGTTACRASLLAALGREDEAVALLSAVIGAAPERLWASAAWLSRPALAESLDPGALASSITYVTQAIADPASEPVRTALEPYYALVKAVVAQHPEHLQLWAMASSLARRMNDPDTAIAWASAAKDLRAEPSGDALGVVMLGSALRNAGRVDEAIELWRETIRQDPTQTYLAVDLAETLAVNARPQEGIEVLEQVLASEPEHEKAAPAIHALRYQAAPDARHLIALYEHLQRHPEHDYAGYLLQTRCQGKAWLGRIDMATEAVTNGIRQFINRYGPGSENRVEMQLSGIEPPSAGLAARLAVPGLQITVAQAGTPDPRRPIRAVDYLAWRYEGLVPVPAVGAPSDRALALARELAAPRWASPASLSLHARPLGELPVSDLLGLLVHPPTPSEARWPDGLAAKAPDVWLRAVQTLACVGITHHLPDEPWAESTRRAVLLDLLDGPEDWVCEAAGMALVAVGWTYPDARAEIAERLVARLSAAVDASETRPVTILASLCRLTLACAWLEPGVVSSLNTLLTKTLEATNSAEEAN